MWARSLRPTWVSFTATALLSWCPSEASLPWGAVPETLRVRVGGIFETGMYEIDNTLAIMSLQDVEKMAGLGATGVEVKLADVYKANEEQREIATRLGPEYFTRTWIQMNKNLFSALKLEKIVMFVILALIIFVASFNIVSSLIMTVMEKTEGHRDPQGHRGKEEKRHEDIHGGRDHHRRFRGSHRVPDRLPRLRDPDAGTRFSNSLKMVYYISVLPMKISIFDVGLIALITTCICILATLYPSYRAAKIDPVETLRYE